jgi:hypothetical protein
MISAMPATALCSTSSAALERVEHGDVLAEHVHQACRSG